MEERDRIDMWGLALDETSTFVQSWRTYTPEHIIALRLALACLFGGLIGLERELGHHDAGLRTHMLTALAAAVFTLVAWELYQHIRAVEEDPTGDPIRVIEAVTAGAGFLAAGIIFQSGAKVHGLTTGAGVWTAAAIGVACGSGAYSIAAMTTALVLLVLFGLGLMKRKVGLEDDPAATPPDRQPEPAQLPMDKPRTIEGGKHPSSDAT